jgi:hypothetical protein
MQCLEQSNCKHSSHMRPRRNCSDPIFAGGKRPLRHQLFQHPFVLPFSTGNSVVSQTVKLRMAENTIFIIYSFIWFSIEISGCMQVNAWEQQEDLELTRGYNSMVLLYHSSWSNIFSFWRRLTKIWTFGSLDLGPLFGRRHLICRLIDFTDVTRRDAV